MSKSLRLIVDLDLQVALDLSEFLNHDEGLRNAAADKMLNLKRPDDAAKYRRIVSGLGAISREIAISIARVTR